jgi:hypothetical protein
MPDRTNAAAARAREASPMTPATPNSPDNHHITDPGGDQFPTEDQAKEDISRLLVGRFKPISDLPSECLSDAELISVSEEKDEEKWNPHIKGCGRCGNVVNLLRQAETKRISLDEFLANASKEVRQSRKEKRRSSYWWAFYNIYSPQQVALAVVIIVALFALLGIWYVKNTQSVSPPQYAVVMPEDDLGKVTEWLRAANNVADDSSIPQPDKIVKFKTLQGERTEINQKLKSITQTPLEPSERAELAQLVSTYNSEIKLLNATIQSKGGASGETQHLEMEPNKDSVVVSIVLLTIAGDESVSLLDTYSFQGSQKQDIDMARTIVKGSKELNFTALANNQVEVQDLSLGRSETDRARISGRLAELKQNKGIDVKFVSTPTGTLPTAFTDKRSLTAH